LNNNHVHKEIAVNSTSGVKNLMRCV